MNCWQRLQRRAKEPPAISAARALLKLLFAA
jgi:hypothetical protein